MKTFIICQISRIDPAHDHMFCTCGCDFFFSKLNVVACVKVDMPIWKQSSDVSWKMALCHSGRDLETWPASVFSFCTDASWAGMIKVLKVLPNNPTGALSPLTLWHAPRCDIQTDTKDGMSFISDEEVQIISCTHQPSEGQYPVWRGLCSESLILRVTHTVTPNFRGPPWKVWWVKDLIFQPEQCASSHLRHCQWLKL